jgi:HAD superfamily hydrolase (TIGR01490 family)
MSCNSVPLAIFDFDGTLSKGHLWMGIAKHHKVHKVQRMTLYSYLIFHMPYWIASKMKLYSEEKNRIKWGEALPVLFKGFSREQANRAFEWVTTNYFQPLMRDDVLALLNDHKKKGYKVVILSGMLADFLEVVGQTFGADFVVGTETETKNGIYTGRIIKPLCFGVNKAKLLEEFIQSRKINVDFSNSYAYADSVSDLPVFDLVGNPVATYPEKGLAILARDRKWKILGNPAIG